MLATNGEMPKGFLNTIASIINCPIILPTNGQMHKNFF